MNVKNYYTNIQKGTFLGHGMKNYRINASVTVLMTHCARIESRQLQRKRFQVKKIISNQTMRKPRYSKVYHLLGDVG